VIDLYCIKPLDIKTITRVVKASGAKVITVEDHYTQGGIGDAVAAALCSERITLHKLAVTELPRSGKPEELLAYAGIDAAAIITHVQRLMAQ
jgi:Transketolase, C-terminal subunit